MTYTKHIFTIPFSSFLCHTRGVRNQQAVLPSPANRRGSHSEGESDDEDKDYTVYECPGLAPVRMLSVLFRTNKLIRMILENDCCGLFGA